MVDVAPQGETLAALAEVATEADALGVTANPGETVAEVRVAEGEAPGPGGEGRTNAPEPERETRRRPPNPSAPPPRRRSSAPVVQARDDRGAPVRWVLGGVILGLALSGLSPEYSEPANSPEVHAHRDGADSPMAPGGFLPFGFRASAANRAASRDASAEEVIPFGGVPRTAEDARAALENRRSNRPIHPNTLHDEASEKVRVGSLRDRLARGVTSVVACASLFLPMSRSMARWPTPAFLLGVVAIVVFALSVNNALDVTANGSGWTRRHDQSPGVVLGTPLGTQRTHADIVAKIEVSNGPDGVIRVGAPTSRTTSRTNGVPRDGGLKSRHAAHDVVTADSRRLASWGCEELTLWLKSEAGDWAGAYRERMCRLGMNADLLLTAEDADLRADLGVTSRMHRRALLAAAGKLRETLAHAAVRGDDAAAKVWIGRLDGDGPNDDTNDDAGDSGVKPPSMDQSSNDSDSGYVLPGAIASLSRWRSVAPVHRTAQILGVANCPRLRMLRDVTIGDGSLAALAGIARLDGNGARTLDKSLLALWFVSPGVLVTLRSHELWGLGSPAGGFGVVLGFALVAMWCHGMLEIATRFGGTAGVVSNTRVGVTNTRRRPRGGGRRSIAGEGLEDDDEEDDSSDAGGWSRDAYPFSPGIESAAYLVLTRCVYPGAARALMLEAASLTMHATHSCLVDAVFIVGGVGLPLSRVGYRCWYVSSRGRGSQFWSDLRHVVRARVGLGGSGDARGVDDLGERARGPREAWASGDDWAEIAYGYAREDDSAINNSSAADEATDTSIMVDDIAVSNSPDRSSEETRGGDGRRRDTVDADQVRAMTVEAMERIIFGPVGNVDRSLDVLEDLGRGHARGTDGQGANTRDAGTGAGSVTTHTTATATGVGTGTETVLLARDVDRARSSRHSSSSSASRSHWPGPVQLPEWINEERAPSHFKCPITLCVMREPAVTPAGITYERSALMQWLDHQHVEPSTKRRLKRSHVVPNLTLRAMIEDWLQHERDVRSGKSGGTGGVDGSSGGRIDNHGGLPPGAAAVLQADRDALRAVRQRMYAALKERAAMGVCYEEQRWEAYRENRNREEGDGTINPEGPDVEGVAEDTSGGESGSGSTSPERIRMLQSARVTGAHRTGLASVFGPELPAEPSNQSAGEEPTADPPGSLDATLDDAAMND